MTAAQRIQARLDQITDELTKLQTEANELKITLSVLERFEASNLPLAQSQPWDKLTFGDAAERAIRELGSPASVRDIATLAAERGFRTRDGEIATHDAFRRRMVEAEKRFRLEEDGRFSLIS